VSRGIVEAWYEGRIDAASRLRAVNDSFQRAGIQLQRPFLNAGNADAYQWPN